MSMSRLVCVLCFAYGYRTLNPYHAAAAGAVQGQPARDEELSFAGQTLQFLRYKKLPRYEIWTIINKQDLWWDERQTVDSYYQAAYEPLIAQFRAEVGANNFEHFKFPLCLVRSTLKDAAGVNFKEQSSNYDDSLRRNYLTYFRNHVANYE